MKKILAFAGSISSTSINKQLVQFSTTKIEDAKIDIIDLRDFNLPIYSIDEEKKAMPKDALRFSELFKAYDGIILSLAEHNGSYAVGFKNIFDWSSRIDTNVFQDKPMLLMSTTPGGRGGKSVLEAAEQRFTRMGAASLYIFSFPNFYDNFKEDKIINNDLDKDLDVQVQDFIKAINTKK